MPKRRVPRHEVIQPLDKPYRFIPLTQRKNAIADVEDFPRLDKYNWLAVKSRDGNFYAKRWRYSDKRWIHMANAVLRRKPGNLVDHIKHHRRTGLFSTLDNRKKNLRAATWSQNMRNGKVRSNNKSGYHGVYYDKTHKRWVAQIRHHGKGHHIGCFDTAIEGAIARDKAAKKFHGKFAILNFP